MEIKKEELSKEVIQKAMQCKSIEELMKIAKAEGYNITKEEAEAYFTELADVELDDKNLKNIAGGIETCWAVDGCSWH